MPLGSLPDHYTFAIGDREKKNCVDCKRSFNPSETIQALPPDEKATYWHHKVCFPNCSDDTTTTR